MSLRTLDAQVRYCLEKFPATRNSDITLTQQLWMTFHKGVLLFSEQYGYCAQLTKLFDLPREDNVKRVRAKIQNTEFLFLPTSLGVAKKRGWHEEDWLKYLRTKPSVETPVVEPSYDEPIRVKQGELFDGSSYNGQNLRTNESYLEG
jgi:hypothetical protein